LLTLSAATLLAEPPETLAPAPADDPKIVHRWTLEGDPHGLAIGSDGTIYAGLAQPQAVVAIDARTGIVKKRVVLDSAEIASTKELVTLRMNRERTRLYVANGSDESASILALPELNVVREITMEGEAIRDVVPDPKGRYIYLLGRRVHVFDGKGETELRTIALEEPSAIAATASTLAIAAGKEVVTFDVGTFAERARVPIGVRATSLVQAAEGLVALGSEGLSTGGRTFPICLPTGAGPQAATAATELVLFAEKRCNSSGPVPGAASLYGVAAYAVAFDAASSTLATTERAGYLTIYKVPRAAVAK
jgi:hypothetical protein